MLTITIHRLLTVVPRIPESMEAMQNYTVQSSIWLIFTLMTFLKNVSFEDPSRWSSEQALYTTGLYKHKPYRRNVRLADC